MTSGNAGGELSRPREPTVRDAHLRRIVTSYGLPEIDTADYLPQGRMNDSWRLATAAGEYSLKRYRNVDPDVISRNLHAVAYVERAGLPACAPLMTADGEVIIMFDGQHYALFPWVLGHQRAGAEMSDAQLELHGRCLGNIHIALNDVNAPLPKATSPLTLPVHGLEATLNGVNRARELVAEKWPGSSFERLASESLTQRLALISDHADLAPTTERVATFAGWTHGDYLLKNVLWVDDVIVGVLDWDWIDVRAFAAELVRSAFKVFVLPDGSLDLLRVQSFVRGYRSVLDLPSPELDDVVVRMWWERLGNTWQLSHRLEHDDTQFDRSFVTSCRLAEWWTSHFDEVRQAFSAA